MTSLIIQDHYTRWVEAYRRFVFGSQGDVLVLQALQPFLIQLDLYKM